MESDRELGGETATTDDEPPLDGTRWKSSSQEEEALVGVTTAKGVTS